MPLRASIDGREIIAPLLDDVKWASLKKDIFQVINMSYYHVAKIPVFLEPAFLELNTLSINCFVA